MAYDTNDLPAGLIAEMLEDVVEAETAFADMVCRRITKPSTLSGNIAIRGGGVSRGNNMGLAPLEEADPYDYENGSVAFDAKAYVGFGLLSKEERINADAFFDDDALQNEIRNARRDANTALDRKLAAQLLSTSLNTEFDVSAGTGEWNDGGTTSVLADDLRYCREELAFGADTIIVGRNVRNTGILNHSDFLATAAAFGGGGTGVVAGAAPASAMDAWLKQVCGFTNVFTFEKLYESAGINATSALAYLFDDNVWIGHGENLILVHPSHADQDGLDYTYEMRKRAWLIQHDRYDDIIRPTKRKGVICTSVLA